MGIFDRIEKVTTGSQGNGYLAAGLHTLKIVECKEITGGYRGDSFVAVFEVVDSTRPEYQRGMKRDFVRNVTRQGDTAVSDIKAFLAAACGLPPEEVTAEIAKDAVAPSQDLAGTVLICEATDVPLKDSDRMFTRLSWRLAN